MDGQTKNLKSFEDGEWKGEGELPDEFTDAEQTYYEKLAAALAIKHGVSKVYPVVAIDPVTLERKVCYLKEPNYLTKLTLMDKAVALGPYMAADELRTLCLLKEDSDAITYGESAECDRYKLGVVDFCMSIVTRLQNQFKKK